MSDPLGAAPSALSSGVPSAASSDAPSAPTTSEASPSPVETSTPATVVRSSGPIRSSVPVRSSGPIRNVTSTITLGSSSSSPLSDGTTGTAAAASTTRMEDDPLSFLMQQEQQIAANKASAPVSNVANENNMEWWMQQDIQKASDLLSKKAMVLMGLSEETGVTTERGAQFKREADELLAFAEELKTSDHAKTVMESAHTLLEQLNNQYSSSGLDQQTAGLRSETIKIWEGVANSNEADTLLKSGADLLAQWSRFATSTDEGKALVESTTKLLQDQSKTLLANEQSASLLAQVDPSAGPIVDRSKLRGLTTQVTDVGAALQESLKDDSDVNELMQRAQADLRNFALFAQDTAHASVLESENIGVDPKMLSEKEKNALVIMAGEKYLREVRESDLAKKLIAQGSELIASGQLAPEALLGGGNSLYNDAQARQQFINQVKDSALAFLMSYLPTAHVPPVAGSKDNVDYKIHNIDLSGFKVLSEDVEVLLSPEEGFVINAKNISCIMKNLGWWYHKNSFPKMSGDGKAEAIADGVTFHMRLVLDSLPPAATSAASPSSSASASLSSASPSSPSSLSVSTDGMKPLAASLIPTSRLKLAACEMRLATFQLKISEGSFKFIYNFLLKLFSTSVREYIESTLNTTMQESSTQLLDTINGLAVGYMPLIARIISKADDVVKVKTGESVLDKVATLTNATSPSSAAEKKA